MSSLSEASAKQDTHAAEHDPAAPEQVTKMQQPLPEEEEPDWTNENYVEPVGGGYGALEGTVAWGTNAQGYSSLMDSNAVAGRGRAQFTNSE